MSMATTVNSTRKTVKNRHHKWISGGLEESLDVVRLLDDVRPVDLDAPFPELGQTLSLGLDSL